MIRFATTTVIGKLDTRTKTMKDKKLNRLLFFAIFLAFVIYYGLIHPLVPFDTDDWMNMTISRPFYPSLHCWNPTKVFPERLEPAAATIAARFVAPIIGDYVNALIFVNAIVVSFFITLYLYLVQRLLTDRFRLSLPCSFCIVVLYAIIHFLILKTKETGNDYLWYAEDCNCYHHYIVSNLLCASLVLWLMLCDVNKLMKGWRVIVLVIVTYFALCSNLYSTVILIAFVGAKLVYELLAHNKKESKWLGNYIKRHSYFLVVLFLWLVVQLIEINGIRANTYGHVDDSLWEYIQLSTQNLLALRFNIGIITILTLVLLGAKSYHTLVDHHRMNHIGKQQVILLLAAFLSLLYLILLSSKVKPENMLKGQIVFSWVFFLLLLIILCLGYLCSRIKWFRCLLPLFFFLLVFNIRNVKSEFLGVQCLWGTTEYECIDKNRDIINQVRFAEAMGRDSVIIRVPKFEYKDNWPLAFDCGFAVGYTLRKHVVVRRHLKTTFSLEE